jgi:uncharacterized protein YbbK (DUF523 family)
VKNKKILVSACITGKNCRYDGDNRFDKKVMDFLENLDYISICPEELAGLENPRPPAEILVKKSGENVICERKVLNREGVDVTGVFEEGARKTLELVRSNGIKTAILKDKSPSCGSRFIYSGDFSQNLVEGAGITAELLIANGIIVLDENNFKEKLKLK